MLHVDWQEKCAPSLESEQPISDSQLLYDQSSPLLDMQVNSMHNPTYTPSEYNKKVIDSDDNTDHIPVREGKEKYIYEHAILSQFQKPYPHTTRKGSKLSDFYPNFANHDFDFSDNSLKRS